MLLAAFEPGKEMAIANFFLAIFCLFTVALPLLLITRGDKTEGNRNFLAATVNPWSQVVNETQLASVVVSEIPSTLELDPTLELVSEQNIESIQESENVISLEITECDQLDKSSTESIDTNDELLAA